MDFRPLVHAVDDGQQGTSVRCDFVFYAWWNLSINDPFDDAVCFQLPQLIRQGLFADFWNILQQQTVAVSIGADHVDDTGFPFSSNDIHAKCNRAIARNEVFCLSNLRVFHWSKILVYIQKVHIGHITRRR